MSFASLPAFQSFVFIKYLSFTKNPLGWTCYFKDKDQTNIWLCDVHFLTKCTSSSWRHYLAPGFNTWVALLVPSNYTRYKHQMLTRHCILQMTQLFHKVLNADVPPISQMFKKCHCHPGEFLYLQTGLDFHTTTEACLAEQICKLWSFQVQIHYWPPWSIFRNSPDIQQIHYRPLQSVFRNNPEMHINSLPTTTINLQIQPRDAHKSPPKTFLGNSKVSHLLQLGLRFVKVRALQALLETQTHMHIRSFPQFESEHQLTQCFSFQSQNVICKEAGTLYLLRWKRKMSQQSCHSLLLYISLMTCIHSTWQNGWNWSLKTLLDSLVGY